MWPPRSVWVQQAGAMWVAAALLGPVCDGRHSAHDVLHYATDSIVGPPLLLQMGGQVVLETCWWVPVAFGGACLVCMLYLLRAEQTQARATLPRA